MSTARRPGLAWLLIVLWSLCAPARADDDAPLVDAGVPLVVLKVQGTSFANVRAQADPRSALLMQLAVGSTSLRATGAVKLYGDTWWVEIQSGGVTGWLNGRLIGRTPGNAPLQPLVDIDALPPVAGYAFAGSSYRETGVTSFDECARRCVGEAVCVAVEYRSANAVCRMFDTRPDAIAAAGVEIAATPVKTPAGGWAIQSAARFDRVQDQGADGDGYRNTIAHAGEECAAGCALDQRCAAFAYQRKKRLCSAYERVDKLSPRAGTETGIRRAAPPPLDAAALVASLPAPAVATPSRAAGTKEPVPDHRAAAARFLQLFERAGQAATYATLESDYKGRIAFTLTEPALGGPMHAAVMPRALEGTYHNLAAMIGRTDGRIVHLAYFAEPAAPPVILASSVYATADEAKAAAINLQRDIDGLATAVGLGVDPLSLLKPLRR